MASITEINSNDKQDIEVSVPLRGLRSWQVNQCRIYRQQSMCFSPLAGIKVVARWLKTNFRSSATTEVSVPLRGLRSWQEGEIPRIREDRSVSVPLRGLRSWQGGCGIFQGIRECLLLVSVPLRGLRSWQALSDVFPKKHMKNVSVPLRGLRSWQAQKK